MLASPEMLIPDDTDDILDSLFHCCALAAFLDCQVATHRFWFAVWCEREEITKAMIERLTAGPGKVM